MPSPFVRYELRSKDLSGARRFYEEVFGASFWERGNLSLVPLPERAAALGAPQHWLGHLHCGDVDEFVRQTVAAGGQQLGPIRDGAARVAALRDPFGAVVGVSTEAPSTKPPVAWHLHASVDPQAAFEFYNRHLLFPSGANGSFSDAARLPHIHSQWLYFFRANDAAVVARVETLGGRVLGQFPIAESDGVAVPCEDAQGGAFGLYVVKQ